MDDALRDRKSQPCATKATGVRAVDLTEGVKQQMLLIIGNADTGITYRNLQLPLNVFSMKHHFPLLGKLHRIAQQIGQHLFHAVFITPQTGWQVDSNVVDQSKLFL